MCASRITMFKNRKTAGFTLLELLVVITIMGMLASIVLASLRVTRIKAEHAKLRITLQQISIAAKSYQLDKGEFPPIPVGESGGGGGGGLGS